MPDSVARCPQRLIQKLQVRVTRLEHRIIIELVDVLEDGGSRFCHSDMAHNALESFAASASLILQNKGALLCRPLVAKLAQVLCHVLIRCCCRIMCRLIFDVCSFLSSIPAAEAASKCIRVFRDRTYGAMGCALGTVILQLGHVLKAAAVLLRARLHHSIVELALCLGRLAAEIDFALEAKNIVNDTVRHLCCASS